MSKLLAALGLVAIAGALLLGLLPVQSHGVACGSAFAPDDSAAMLSAYAYPDCDGARESRRIPAIILAVVGLGAMVGSAVTYPRPVVESGPGPESS